MIWTRERLETEWIREPMEAIGDRASSALSAFDCIERHLGADWLAAHSHRTQGVGPTLELILFGECLAAIETLHGFDVLVDKVRRGDSSALSEMKAVRMFKLMGDVEIELAPDLPVADAMKKPDFRVRHPGERWTYVEVTRPDMSDAAVAAKELLRRLNSVKQVRREFSLEIFLRREPDPNEEGALLAAAIDIADSEQFGTVDLPNLALITKQPFTGPVVTTVNHPGEDNKCPRFGVASGILGGDGTEPQRLVSVRMPFSDDRADAFLKREAKQLSKEEQGFIMMDMADSRSGMRGWNLLLRRRLQSNVHTRVGGICLFSNALELGSTHLHMLFEFLTVDNPHAAQPLPPWILEELQKLEAIDNAKRASPRGQQQS
ncbi:MAG: hypothetical protein WCA63_12365 [Gallionella sp.]